MIASKGFSKTNFNIGRRRVGGGGGWERGGDGVKLDHLTIRPVALEGEGSNCLSITQLVGQKKQ